MDIRRRILPSAALAALSVAVAASFGRVFASDAYLAPLIGAALVPHVLGLLLRARRVAPALRAAASAVALVAYVVWGLLFHTTTAGIPGNATLHELGTRLDAGWAVLRNDRVPVPASAGAILLAVVAVWVMAQIADVIAFDAEASLGALAPAVTVFIWLCALGTDSGATGSPIAVGLTAAMFLAVQHQSTLDRHRTTVGRRGTVTAPRLLSVAAVTALGAVLVAVVVVPEIPGAGSGPVIDLKALGQNSENPSYRTSIAPLIDVGAKLHRSTPEELFTVRSSVPDYWRITALDDYRDVGGGQWTLSAQGDNAISEGLDDTVPPGAITQEYTIGPLDERWMPAAYRPVRVSLDDTLVVRASSTLVTGQPSVGGLHYTVVSDLPRSDVSAAQQAATAQRVPASLAKYTLLPAGFPKTVRDKAHELTDGLATPFAKAKALDEFFRGPMFTYDPTVDLGDDEGALTSFLFVQKRGFCVQFASAYATMARAIGIPARVAVGFTPGTHDDSAGVFRVSTEDAHAWPEIWLAGLGWTHLFDPTPPSHSGSAGGSDLPHDPVGVGQSQQPVVTTTPQVTQPADSTPTAPGGTGTPAAPPRIEVSAPSSGGGGTSIAVAVTVAIALILLASAGACIAILAAKSRRRTARRTRGEPAAAVRGAWEEALDHLRDHGYTPPTGATPLEIAERVPETVGADAAAPMRVLAGAHSAACYGARQPGDADVTLAWDQLDVLDGALGNGLGPIQRLRRRLDPTSLREPRQPVPAGWPDSVRSPATKD